MYKYFDVFTKSVEDFIKTFMFHKNCYVRNDNGILRLTNETKKKD